MHEIVLEAEILTGDGEVLVCSEKKNADLFLDLQILTARYSVTTLSEEEFWTHFPQETYQSLKKKYDPQGIFKTLYEKITQIK
jgi:hypothetical protein